MGNFCFFTMKIAAINITIVEQSIENVFSIVSDCNTNKQLYSRIRESQYSKTSRKKLAYVDKSIVNLRLRDKSQ